MGRNLTQGQRQIVAAMRQSPNSWVQRKGNSIHAPFCVMCPIGSEELCGLEFGMDTFMGLQRRRILRLTKLSVEQITEFVTRRKRCGMAALFNVIPSHGYLFIDLLKRPEPIAEIEAAMRTNGPPKRLGLRRW